MDPRLPKLIVSSMAEVDDVFDRLDPETVQIHVDELTPLMDAAHINARMLAGIRASDALQIFNPELVARKTEAEAAIRVAIERINVRIADVEHEIASTQEEVAALKNKVEDGPDVIRIGPSLRRRKVDRDQVVFPSVSYMPEEGVAPGRKVGLTARKQSRKLDAESQMAFWDLNLQALQQKELLQTAYLDGLVLLRDNFARQALEERTEIGSGYTDFDFCF